MAEALEASTQTRMAFNYTQASMNMELDSDVQLLVVSYFLLLTMTEWNRYRLKKLSAFINEYSTVQTPEVLNSSSVTKPDF